MQGELEALMSKFSDTWLCIIHCHSTSTLFRIVKNFPFLYFSCFRTCKCHFKFAWFISNKISSSVLISKSMSTYNDRLFPLWYKSWNIFKNNWSSKNGTIKLISYCTIWWFPHFLKIKFFNTSFIWCNSCTFNTNFTFFNCFSGIKCNLIICLVSIF